MSEQVNHPEHYLKNGKECIDCMIEEYGVEAVVNFCICNAYKYKWRELDLKRVTAKNKTLQKQNGT